MLKIIVYRYIIQLMVCLTLLQVPVAAKTLKTSANFSERLEFLSEAELMKDLLHENIVKMLGVCLEGEPVYVVMEFMLHGEFRQIFGCNVKLQLKSGIFIELLSAAIYSTYLPSKNIFYDVDEKAVLISL